MEVNDQFHTPAALPPEKEPPVPIGWEAGWVPVSLYVMEKGKILHCRELNLRHPACSLSLYWLSYLDS
jgi:hypothetical protein